MSRAARRMRSALRAASIRSGRSADVVMRYFPDGRFAANAVLPTPLAFGAALLADDPAKWHQPEFVVAHEPWRCIHDGGDRVRGTHRSPGVAGQRVAAVGILSPLQDQLSG